MAEIKVGKNSLIAAGFGHLDPEPREDLAQSILDAPGKLAYALHHNTGIIPTSIDNEDLQRRQGLMAETYLSLQTAMLDRAWLMGDRELVKNILGGK